MTLLLLILLMLLTPQAHKYSLNWIKMTYYYLQHSYRIFISTYLKIFLGYRCSYSVVKMYACNVIFHDSNICCTLELSELYTWPKLFFFFLKVLHVVLSSYIVQNFLNDFEMVAVVITIRATLRLLHST